MGADQFPPSRKKSFSDVKKICITQMCTHTHTDTLRENGGEESLIVCISWKTQRPLISVHSSRQANQVYLQEAHV